MIRVVVGLAIAATYILMVMGNVVTTSGSGLACPDWPLCHGAVIPPPPYNNWIEMGHRLMASLTGTLVLLSTILIWMKVKRGVPKWFTLVALILTGIVAGLGAFVVLSEAPNLESLFDVLLISTHIILAATIFTLMIFTFRMLPQSPGKKVEKFYLLMLGFVVLQVLLGILVRYGQASLACPDFPYCKGVWIPDFIDLKITLQFIHRVNALIIFTISLAYMIDCLRKGHDRLSASVTFVFILAQATIGAYIIWSSMYFPYVVLHGANGFALYGWLVYKAAPHFKSENLTEGV